MKQHKKIRDGIGLYPPSAPRSYPTEQKDTRPFLLAAVQLPAVWFLLFSWWQCLTSVLPIQTDTPRLYLVSFCFTAILVFLWNAPFRALVKWVLLLLLSCLAGAWILRHMDAAVNVINLTANAYLEVWKPDAAPYPLQPVSDSRTALMFALFLLPLLLIWSLAAHIRKGKLSAILLLLAPAVFILIKTGVPSEMSCWLLLLSGSVYCTVCDCREGRAALSKVLSAACVLGLLILLSAFASRPIEPYKEPADGFYTNTRASIKAGLISPLQDSYTKAKAERDEKKAARKENTDPEGTDPDKPDGEPDPEPTPEPAAKPSVQVADSAPEVPLFPTGNETENNSSDPAGNISDDQANAENGGNTFTPVYDSQNPNTDHPGGQDSRGTGSGSPDTFPDLNALSYFQPDTGARLTLTMDVRPEDTVYYPSAYGVLYENSRWHELSTDTDTPVEIYLQHPGTLDRLEALCLEHAPQTPGEASRFIQKEFEEHTVYDFQPGPTPSGQDFAEYFLFENQKGFCVHFATTAVLMYRICGYPARYVQGYAIPPSAFHRQEDGCYAAEATGEMGHAWCEVWEDGEWVLKEHTLPYYGVRPEPGIPAASSTERSWKRNAAGWGLLFLRICAAVLAGFVIFILLFFAQAALRRQRRYQRFRSVRHGAGIRRMYRAIYDTAVFRGMDKTDILSLQGFRTLRDFLLPAVPADALEWLYQTVLESMFYQKKVTREETRRAWRIYRQFSGVTKKELSPSRRFIYNYIKIM